MQKICWLARGVIRGVHVLSKVIKKNCMTENPTETSRPCNPHFRQPFSVAFWQQGQVSLYIQKHYWFSVFRNPLMNFTDIYRVLLSVLMCKFHVALHLKFIEKLQILILCYIRTLNFNMLNLFHVKFTINIYKSSAVREEKIHVTSH